MDMDTIEFVHRMRKFKANIFAQRSRESVKIIREKKHTYTKQSENENKFTNKTKE